MADEELKMPLCFVHRETGDLLIVWWAENRPSDPNWLEISYNAWKALSQ